MRYALTLMIAAAVIALAACGGASPSTSSAPLLPSRTASLPAPSVQPSPNQSPTLRGTCALGYEQGTHTFPDTAYGLVAATSASSRVEPHMAFHVSIANTGSVVAQLHALVIIFDEPSIPETIQTPFYVSLSLAAGASWDHWQDMGTPDKPEPISGVAVHMSSESTFQLFTCRILGWH